MVDVGTGVERELGISKEKLKQKLDILEMEDTPFMAAASTGDKSGQTDQH